MRASLLAFALAFAGAACAQELGTLFHTPKEREALERMRRGESVTQGVVEVPDPVITGFVKRSDGKSTVFLDKRPYPATNPKLQRLLDPRIVERYEPLPLPPEPAQAAAPPVAEAPASPKPAEPPKSPAPKAKKPAKED